MPEATVTKTTVIKSIGTPYKPKIIKDDSAITGVGRDHSFIPKARFFYTARKLERPWEDLTYEEKKVSHSKIQKKF